MRNSKKLDNNWLWTYYQSEGGKIKDPQDFIDKFYFEEVPINFNGEIVAIQKVKRDFSNFFEDMDKKFEVVTVWDEENNFLKAF